MGKKISRKRGGQPAFRYGPSAIERIAQELESIAAEFRVESQKIKKHKLTSKEFPLLKSTLLEDALINLSVFHSDIENEVRKAILKSQRGSLIIQPDKSEKESE